MQYLSIYASFENSKNQTYYPIELVLKALLFNNKKISVVFCETIVPIA
jgi:hypothetical protein